MKVKLDRQHSQRMLWRYRWVVLAVLAIVILAIVAPTSVRRDGGQAPLDPSPALVGESLVDP